MCDFHYRRPSVATISHIRKTAMLVLPMTEITKNFLTKPGKSSRNFCCSRCAGLDTAYPMFGNADAAGRLDPDDAILVDAIHTCGGSLGFPDPYTQVDFYPNGGIRPQPGCDASDVTGEPMPWTPDHDGSGLKICFLSIENLAGSDNENIFCILLSFQVNAATAKLGSTSLNRSKERTGFLPWAVSLKRRQILALARTILRE